MKTKSYRLEAVQHLIGVLAEAQATYGSDHPGFRRLEAKIMVAIRDLLV